MIYLSKYYILKMKKVFFQIIFISLFFSCKSQLSPIKSALNSTNEKIVRVMENNNIHDIQAYVPVLLTKSAASCSKTLFAVSRPALANSSISGLEGKQVTEFTPSDFRI